MLDGKLRNTSNFIGISCDSTFSFRFPSCLVCLPHYPNSNKKTYVTPPPPPPPPSTTRAAAEAASKPHNMTTSKRLSERKIAKFEKNITRRGLTFSSKKAFEPAHIVLLLFGVLVVGSFIFQVVRMALKGEAP